MSTANDERTLQTAHSLRRSGKLHEAADLYRTLVTNDPENLQALHFLGVAEAGCGDFAQAKIHMSQSLSIGPPNIQFIENYATILFQAGDCKSALETCLNGLRLNANSAALLYVSALSYFRLGRFPESLMQFNRLLELQPKHIAALNERAAVLGTLKQYDAALVSVDKAIALDPRYAEAHLNKAILCGQVKHYEDAVAAYDKALALRPKLVDAWLGRGDAYGALKRLDDALASYDKALAAKPDRADAWLGRGNALFVLRRLDDALAAYDKAVALRPELTNAWLGRGNVLGECKRYNESMAAYERTLALDPDVAEAWLGRGNVLRECARYEEALAAYDRALTLKPDLPGAWLGRGNVYYEQENYDNAIAAYERAVALQADLADAWLGRGNVFERLGQSREALSAYAQAMVLKPDYPEALLGRGNVLEGIRHYDDALRAYNKALDLRPGYAKAWSGRGNIYSELRRFDDALAAYDRALELKPDLAEAWFGRGRTYSRMDRDDEAIAAQGRALALKPDFPEALLGRAICYLETNRDLDALADLDQALEIKPDFEPAIIFRIWVLDFAKERGIKEQQEARRHWWEHVGAKAAAQSNLQYNNARDPDRPIRVGYVSGDFRFHSAALAFQPMLANHDKSRFDITCYYTATAEDEFTKSFQAKANRWRSIAQLSDDEFCEQVRADEIDILVDLSGFTEGQRFAAFARKPAPIQVSAGWTGTGIPAIDYLLSHPVICPPAIRSLFAETIVDMPTLMPIVPLPPDVALTDPPVLQKGYVTFGAFNRATKVSDDVLALWARILDAVPHSRLLMKHYGFDNKDTRDRMLKKFESNGIAPDRLSFLGKTARGEHLAAFKDVDISLDPFPANGGISTLESLQMGVPVVALLGSGVSSRIAGGILASVGLNDWVADNPDGYLEIAAKFASMPDRLKVLRSDIPRIMSSHPAGNAALYTRALEAAYRKMWVEYCRPKG